MVLSMYLLKIKELKNKNSNSSFGCLSDEEIEKMVKDAEANKDSDKRKEAVDVRNQADTLIHSTEKNLKEHGSKVSDADKKAIEDTSAH